MSKTLNGQTVEWNNLNWRKLERFVFKLQKRIFQASSRGDIRVVRRLQKTLMRSWSAKCLAVRKVTQDNKGKKTAGVDGVKSVSPQQRLILAENLKLTGKSKPTRRIWIPKPGKAEKRPLGIPTMQDRALQALVKLALEPEWEAIFEPNSYGFRPARSVHDAIGAIYEEIKQKAKYVLECDISKCFDKIDHTVLLGKLNTFPSLHKQVKAWLKSGVMDNKEFSTTDEGTPQGGVISPLLMNIALHGLEEFVTSLSSKRNAEATIRYADDFVIIHPDKTKLESTKIKVEQWLSKMGLEINPDKTSICHASEGFNFLGFNCRQYSVGAYRASKVARHGKTSLNLGFKTLTKPSKEAIKRHLLKVAKIIDEHHGSPQSALIARLNPVIRGWCNYYSTAVSKEIFSYCDHKIYEKLLAWGKRKCTRTGTKDIVNKYWHTVGEDKWVFSTSSDGLKLIKHSATPIIRHVKVQKNRSPFDGDKVYWGKRMQNNPELPTRVSKLLKEQKGKCAFCREQFAHGDLMEVDHIQPTSKGGKDVYTNLQLLHRHCHDTKTVNDGSLRYS